MTVFAANDGQDAVAVATWRSTRRRIASRLGGYCPLALGTARITGCCGSLGEPDCISTLSGVWISVALAGML